MAALLQKNPFMVYFGQEVGERGMDEEGFSGKDGRTTIFDYWRVDSVRREFFTSDGLTEWEKSLQKTYREILRLANREKAVREGECFDLMYANNQTWQFNPREQFAFMRKKDDEVLLIVVNFSRPDVRVSVVIPNHAFDFLGLPEREVVASDLPQPNILIINWLSKCSAVWAGGNSSLPCSLRTNESVLILVLNLRIFAP